MRAESYGTKTESRNEESDERLREVIAHGGARHGTGLRWDKRGCCEQKRVICASNVFRLAPNPQHVVHFTW